MIAWMLYAALVGGIVAVGGLALEHLAAAGGRPRRIAWLGALTLAVLIPLAGGLRKPAPPVAEAIAPGPAATGEVMAGELWSALPSLHVPEGVATGRIAALAWAAGSLASLAVLGGVLVLVARRRRRWERRRVRGAEVYVSRRFGPALVGVARPKVVIPAWVLQLEPGARDAIIRHEVEHARARDHLVLLYAGLLVAALPWSPTMWWMYRRLRAALELDCDQRVLASGIGVAYYGDVLLDAGCRSRGRWGFSPAMGQPESLLERRLKTMSETPRKLNVGHAVLLAAVAVGALAAACDAPVPTELREALEEVVAEEEVRGTDAEAVRSTARFVRWEDFFEPGDLAPLIYLDGVRIRGFHDVPESSRRRFGDGIEPHAIATIEVLKGPEATKLYGKEGAAGVIRIFTKEVEADAQPVAVPSVGETAVRGRAGVERETGPPVRELFVTGVAREHARMKREAERRARELAVTGVPRAQAAAEPEAELVVAPSARHVAARRAAVEREAERRVRELVVTGAARARSLAKPEAELILTPSFWKPGVKDEPQDLEKWLSETGVANAPPGSRPVIYVDGVRVDGPWTGPGGLHPALTPDRIDRIEVIKGDEARKLFGEEAVNGVIQVFTRKVPSE